jgi:hypothetical protein
MKPLDKRCSTKSPSTASLFLAIDGPELDLLNTGLSFTGAAIGGKAVGTAFAATRALNSSRSAYGAFAALDHALPEGSPVLRPTAMNYMNRWGAYQTNNAAAELWAQASLAVTVNETIAVGVEQAWNRSQ